MAGENLGTRIGSAFIEVSASLIGFGQNLASDISNALLSQGTIVGAALEQFGQAVFTRFSLPLLAATTANIAQFQALDHEIRTVLTLFGTAESIVDDTFSTMAEGVRGLSEEVGGLEKDISEGLYQAISAGVPRGGVFEFLDVAQMAAIADRTADLTTAVDGLTTVINAFGLESTDAERAADVMFQTVALGKTTFGELSTDIGRVAPLAANAGVAFEELFAIIGALTLQGLKTSEAISFLRAAITGLFRPTDELNEVFREAGYASAEAAVPIIGLQDAFQLVFDSVDGSTSKLQELIGSSEGVSAALGVTGENADTFARIMSGVENSTGSTTRAFDIMDQSVGRTFGRLTESFDRLGNTFGAFAADIAVPAVEALTGVVNSMIDIFERFSPIIQGLADVVGTFMGAFNLPILRDVAAIFGTIAVSTTGLIGALGLLSLTFGKVLLAGLQLKAVRFVVSALGGVIDATQAAVASTVAPLGRAATAAAQLGVAGKLAGGALTGLQRIMLVLSSSPLKAAAAFGGLALALTGIVAGIGYLINKQKEYVESQEVMRKGVDQLIDSLGLVNQAISLAGAEEGESTLARFTEQNIDTLQVLRSTVSELGRLAASDIGEAIAVELVFRGNTPEDVLAAIEQLENASGIAINLDLADLEDGERLISEFSEGLAVSAQRIGGPGGFGAQINNTAQGILTLFQRAFATGDVDGFVSGIEGVRDALNDLPLRDREFALDRLGDELNKIFQEEYGFKLTGFFDDQGNPITDPQQFLDALAAGGFEIKEIPIEVRPTLPEGYDPSTDFAFATEGFGLGEGLFEEIDPAVLEFATQKAKELGFEIHEVIRIGEQGVSAYEGLMADTASLFAGVKTQVLGAMDEISASLEAQNPLLDIYGGKIKQSFDEWKKGQDQFQEDVKAVTTLRETLVNSNLPTALIEAFDRQPIEKQAWLAALGEDDLETALAELAESFEIIDENSKTRILQSFEGIMTDAQTTITEGFVELQNEAADQGPLVAGKFDTEFGKAAANWAITAESYMAALVAQIEGTFIPGPVVGAPQWSSLQFGPTGGPAVGPGGVIVAPTFVNPTSHDATEDANRTVGVLQTATVDLSRIR